jgi:uncharacterized protein
MTSLRDNAVAHRFELDEAGETAFADYRRTPGRLIIDHVEAPPALRGTGAAGRLMEGVVAEARREGLRIAPLCSYAAAWLQSHPEHSDVLVP